MIGAGATGLAAAYLLKLNGADVTILEASAKAGGLLATFDVGDGHRLEHFYHHFFTHDAEINWLLSELGISDKVIFLPTTMGVLRNKHIYDFDGPRDLLNFDAISWLDRLRFGLSSALLAYVPSYAESEDQSALEWFDRWAGSPATEAIWKPLLNIKFGEAADRIPLAWMAGRLRQRARSRKGAEERLGYLDGSLQVLVDRLLDKLKDQGVVVSLGMPVERLIHVEGKLNGVQTSDGVLYADAVISTIPTDRLIGLVNELSPDYAQELSQIEYLGAICTVLSLREQLSPVYWLNIADPGFDFGGVIEHTNFIPSSRYGGKHLVYLSRYLPPSDPLWKMNDSELLSRQLNQLQSIFQRNAREIMIDNWIFRGRYAAPLTDRGFAKRIPKFRSRIPNLYVASMCHVYPDERSTNNSIRVAAELVRAMGLDAGMVPRGMSLAAKYGS